MRSGPVTALKFAGPNTVASRSRDGSTKFLDVETGRETKEAVPEGFTFPKQGGAQKHSVGSYVVEARGQTLCILKTADGKAETAPVSFFQCASEITAFDVSELDRSHIAVGCADGQQLQLRAAVLLT